jgi:aminoglycoside/choline kinase family phosphotransferase
MNEMNVKLKKLYRVWAAEKAISVSPIAQSGSYRKYFRINGKEKTAIGVFNPDRKENQAFITFTRHFLKKGLSVPELYNHDLTENIYLIEDLGDTTLFSLIEKEKTNDSLSEKVLDYYKDALTQLIRFQIDGGKGLDYSVCYPREKFDKQSIVWDLNYFKYYFLKLAKIPFDEQKLENDFNTFSEFLLSADKIYFMYRDFQSRNILIHHEQLYFIDYQGGRKGALQYDVSSLLYQAKISLSPEIRNSLLEFYLNELHQKSKVKRQTFLKHYYSYVLIRLLQTFGAYGFRGYYENKSHFLVSIPYALRNLQWLLDRNLIPKKLPELNRVLVSILKNEELKKINSIKSGKKLKITINSFSYREGIPKDFSGNGGGFVFDCRYLDNPGRYPKYLNSTGLDENVIRFLNGKSDVKDFLNSVYAIVDESVKNYIQRDFKNLMINFGCTGGQHRSVYCAEELSKHLRNDFDISVVVNHTQLKKEDKN